MHTYIRTYALELLITIRNLKCFLFRENLKIICDDSISLKCILCNESYHQLAKNASLAGGRVSVSG